MDSLKIGESDIQSPLLNVTEDKGENQDKEDKDVSSIDSSSEDFFFGEDSNVQVLLFFHVTTTTIILQKQKRIKSNSIFQHIRSWRLAHMILKSGADLKEEQFAIQLIQQFDQIFKVEGIDLCLTPYEIISLGNNEKQEQHFNLINRR